MDLSFTAEEEAFRAEVRVYIRENLDPVTHRKMIDGRIPSKDEVVALSLIHISEPTRPY